MVWRSSISLACLIIVAAVAGAASSEGPDNSYRVRLRTQQGYFLRKPLTDLATSRMYLDAEQRLKGASHWQVLMSGRLRVEGAYGQNQSRFSQAMSDKESVELELRDTYLHLSEGGFSARLGIQTVVWGETFGFFYADVVNPKDLRESVLTGLADQADLRKPVPMANLQWLGENSSFQAIYVMGPASHKIPDEGSPFFPLKSPGALPLSLVDKTKESRPDGDWGARIGHNFGNLDMSVFWFDHRDRMPFYELDVFNVNSRLKRTRAVGLTGTWQWGEHLFRLEEVSFSKRRFNTVERNVIENFDADNHIAVLGWDLPPANDWRFGTQFSMDLIDANHTPWRRKKSESLVSARLSKEWSKGHTVQLISAYNTNDRSSLTTFKASCALSSSLEFLFGLESMQGKRASQFGSINEGSRVMLGLRGTFGG